METPQIVCHGCLSQVEANLPKCPYCGHSFENQNPAGTLPVGTVLVGRYTLDKCVALDGEGVSYAAADAQTSKRVLIKEYVPVTICAARNQNGQVVPRRDREVLFKTTRMDFVDLYRSLMAVDDNNGLCRVYDLVEANNTAYAVQEPPVGIALTNYLRRRRAPLTQQEAIALLRPIVYAVEALHRKGLIHRGISCETIFVSSNGRAKLSGFATLGLRKADSELRSQMFEGFSAPEQYSVAEFDGKYTDVYGLSAVFYKAITGQTPPAADRRNVNDTLVSPRNLVDTIPPFVSAALVRGMRLVGTERMQSAPELLMMITEPTKQEIDAGSNGDRSKKILIIVAAAIAAVAVILVIVLLAINLFGGKANSEPESVSESESISESVSVQPEQIKVPSFIDLEYSVIQQSTDYMSNFLFSVSEEFSSVFDAGRVMNQDPAAGTSVDPGTIIRIVVSRGPETVIMPTVVGYARVDAKAALDALGVSYIILERTNDGSYTQDYVVDCDVQAGTAIDPAKKQVTLYVATAPPAPSVSQSEATSEANSEG